MKGFSIECRETELDVYQIGNMISSTITGKVGRGNIEFTHPKFDVPATPSDFECVSAVESGSWDKPVRGNIWHPVCPTLIERRSRIMGESTWLCW